MFTFCAFSLLTSSFTFLIDVSISSILISLRDSLVPTLSRASDGAVPIIPIFLPLYSSIIDFLILPAIGLSGLTVTFAARRLKFASFNASARAAGVASSSWFPRALSLTPIQFKKLLATLFVIGFEPKSISPDASFNFASAVVFASNNLAISQILSIFVIFPIYFR